MNLPQGTTFRTLDDPPVRFESTRTVLLPAGAGQTAEVPVRALEAGSGANVAPGSIQAIEGSLGLSATVINLQRTSGGSDRISRAAGEQDYSRLYDTLITSLAEDGLQQIQSQLTVNQALIAETLSIVDILESQSLPEVGVPADRIRLILKVEYQAWAYNRKDLERVANDALNASLPEGTRPLEDTLYIELLDAPQWKPGEPVYLRVKVSRSVQQKVEASQITAWVRGLPVGTAQEVLADQMGLAEPAKIDLRPTWWQRLPYLTFRIVVEQP